MKKSHLIIGSILWIIIFSSSYVWNSHVIKENTNKIVRNRAESYFSQILVSRAWNSAHNGVYVIVTDSTQPNPYLEDPERDLVTTEGRLLTKINPSYMTRQISEINQKTNDLQFHITSLNPIRPANIPDDWEANALNSFEKDNTTDILEQMIRDTTQVYRYMAPLITEKSCLECHAKQGYKLGEIRGGISITFPSKVFLLAQKSQIKAISVVHLIIILSGLFALGLYSSMSNRHLKLIERKNDELTESYKLIELSNTNLNEAVAKKEKFFSIIAHDLRGPLGSIMGLSDIILKDTGDAFTPQKISLLSSIRDTSQLTFQLLENLLEWAMSETNSIKFEPEILNLRELADENLLLIKSSSLKKKVKIVNDIKSEDDIYADKKMLNTIFRNLISNALKYTNPKGEIRLDAIDIGNEKVISIKDNGVGMSEELLEKIFNNLKIDSTPGTNKEKGTGLGLLLCKEFLAKHNGRIWAESILGEGSTFYFSLTRKQ